MAIERSRVEEGILIAVLDKHVRSLNHEKGTFLRKDVKAGVTTLRDTMDIRRWITRYKLYRRWKCFWLLLHHSASVNVAYIRRSKDGMKKFAQHRVFFDAKNAYII